MNKALYTHVSKNVIMNYLVFHPNEYEDLPLMVYLHGAGERGMKDDHLYRHGVPKLISEGRELAAVVLCPQRPEWAVWDNVVTDVNSIIDTVVKQFSIKEDRICLTGSSMGGFGSWMMGLTYNNFFSAIAPISGGGMSWRGPNISNNKIFAIHGENDEVVPPIYSKLMVDAVSAAGGEAKLVILKELAHNDAIDYAYKNTDVLEWLLSQRKTCFKPQRETFSEWF